jgi:isochorismate synthase
MSSPSKVSRASIVPSGLVGEAKRLAEGATLLSVRAEVSVRDGAAVCLFESALPSSLKAEHRFYWEQPAEGRAIVGIGAAEVVEATGRARFEESAERIQTALGTLAVASLDDAAPELAGPAFVGGFGFEDDVIASEEWAGFAPSSFVLPEVMLAREGNRSWLTATARRAGGETSEALANAALQRLEEFLDIVSDDAAAAALQRTPACANAYTARPDRAHTVYLAAVETATDSIGRGDLEKVVLARSLEVEADAPYDAASVLASLRRIHAGSTIFAVGRGERVFLGASPERLVSVLGETLRTAAVAGSAPRGRSPEEDECHGNTLRESKKEQEEHAVVVREIEAALQPLCDEIEHPEAPSLLKLDGIQHLQTVFEAQLRERAGGRPHVLEIADRLHPTPAVGGTPRKEAASWIREREGLVRGWYAGGVGFVTRGGGGEFHVALRSGLLCGARARLYAGAGIVGASVPEAELAETRLKLRTLLSQLTEI